MQPLEGAKQLGLVTHVKTGAVVPDKKCFQTIRLGTAKLDARGGLLAREFESIAEQVFQDHSQLAAVSPHSKAGLQHKFDRTAGGSFLEAPGDLAGNRA